ncbi:MAG: glycosyltransferase [Candidatus Hydrogenedentes bacterium]|nr:glycosyltransferase [Candidatus Hydrogenedentota bacterium]
MKLLCVVSALDIQYRYGCTAAWWQFLKGLWELGHDVIAIPYQGAAFESPWWRAYPNPCRVEGDAFAQVKKFMGGGATSTQGGVSAAVTKRLIDSWIRPRWESQLVDIVGQERDIDAVIVFGVPLNHFTGIASRLRSKYGTRMFYFDGDVPASLPRFQGFASGFRIYEGADLSEYTGFMCNSQGGCAELLQMGARSAQAVHWGADPSLYEPIECEQDRDVFFYGIGAEYRETWIDALLTRPSLKLTEVTFAAGGGGFPAELGRVRMLGYVPFNRLRHECWRSRINLSISRRTHAELFATSTVRPFELAAMGCCIVGNPHSGIETWFEPDKEIILVGTAEEAIEAYECLLADPARRKAMGEAARRRILECHTHRHRAADIVRCVLAAD